MNAFWKTLLVTVGGAAASQVAAAALGGATDAASVKRAAIAGALAGLAYLLKSPLQTPAAPPVTTKG